MPERPTTLPQRSRHHRHVGATLVKLLHGLFALLLLFAVTPTSSTSLSFALAERLFEPAHVEGDDQHDAFDVVADADDEEPRVNDESDEPAPCALASALAFGLERIACASRAPHVDASAEPPHLVRAALRARAPPFAG